LGLKVVNDGKGYTPGARDCSMALITDGRIYVFGGHDEKG